MTTIEYNFYGRQPDWKRTLMEDDLKVRWSQKERNLKEDESKEG